MNQACLKHIAAGLTVLSLCSAAFAQYVWLDERGVKQFSDRPPPSSVPAGRILKEPGSAMRSVARAETAAIDGPASDAAPAAAEKAPMTIAEKNAEFLKRRAEQAEKDKKAEEQARLAAEKSKNCERAGDYQRVLESGERIARADKSGQRQYLTDEQRAHEINENKRYLRDCG